MNLKKNKKGFSLLEVIITVTVLASGILGVLTLVASSIENSANSRNNIIASELAQEGIELVRNIRDNNMVNDADGVFSVGFPSSSGYICKIDKAIGTIFGCSNGEVDNKRLYLNVSNVYVHSSGGGATETRFQRKIMINNYLDTSGNPANSSSAVRADSYSMVVWGEEFPSGAGCDSCFAVGKCVCIKDVLTEW